MRLLKTICFFICIYICEGCFPSFAPENETKKVIHQASFTIEWGGKRGILDQKFPDYIIIRYNKGVDTLCNAYNIAGLNLNKKSIIIGFYGSPRMYADKSTLPVQVLGYLIIIDSSYLLPVKKAE